MGCHALWKIDWPTNITEELLSQSHDRGVYISDCSESCIEFLLPSHIKLSEIFRVLGRCISKGLVNEPFSIFKIHGLKCQSMNLEDRCQYFRGTSSLHHKDRIELN
jgi:hypothetical protein